MVGVMPDSRPERPDPDLRHDVRAFDGGHVTEEDERHSQNKDEDNKQIDFLPNFGAPRELSRPGFLSFIASQSA